MEKRKAQSTLEYILLVTAVIGVVIVFANGTFKTSLSNTLEKATTKMDTAASTWASK